MPDCVQDYGYRRSPSNRPTAILLGIALLLTVTGCGGGSPEEGIRFVRNSAFDGEVLEVFLTLRDGTDVSVNTADDAVETRPGNTPLPGHQAQAWTLLKEQAGGTSLAYGLASWDPEDPADYLMAGWWAQFPGQQAPDLDLSESERYAIVDGPEIDPAVAPQLPLEGQATYAGQSGGLYAYVPGSDWGEQEGSRVLDEYEGLITLTADFAEGTLSGCIGCMGDLVTRRAHFGVFLGDEVSDVQAVAAGYELHLGAASFEEDGLFENSDVQVKHPERVVVQSEGHWGGGFSNIPDQAGNPRLVAGFSGASFAEADGSEGVFFGVFVGLSEALIASQE